MTFVAQGNDRKAFREVIAKNSKSFALASRLLPEPTRSAVTVIYAWCRHADDAIDRSPRGAEGLALARLEVELGQVYGKGDLDDPTLIALREVVSAYGVPRQYPSELLLGMRMDVEDTRYDSLDQLLSYCYRVAGTVGLMMCHVMGLRDTAALRNAAHLGIAMQITNICRDVLEDFGLGRVYVPRAVLSACGGDFSPQALREGDSNLSEAARQPLRKAVHQLLSEANRYYASADAGLFHLPWRSALAVRSARLIYAAIGDEIRRRRCDVFAGRAVTSLATKVWLIVIASLLTLAEIPRRLRLPFRPAPIDTTVRFPRDVLPI